MSKRNRVLYVDKTPQEIFSITKNILLNKYYNIFMNSMEWDLEREQEDYIMRKFWSEGRKGVWSSEYCKGQKAYQGVPSLYGKREREN